MAPQSTQQLCQRFAHHNCHLLRLGAHPQPVCIVTHLLNRYSIIIFNRPQSSSSIVLREIRTQVHTIWQSGEFSSRGVLMRTLSTYPLSILPTIYVYCLPLRIKELMRSCISCVASYYDQGEVLVTSHALVQCSHYLQLGLFMTFIYFHTFMDQCQFHVSRQGAITLG